MSRGTARSISSSGRPSRARHHLGERLALDHVMRRAGRRDDDVGADQLLGQLLEADRVAAEALGQADRAVVVAVGDEDRLDALGGERARGQLGGLAGADDQHPAVSQLAERALRELDGDRGDRQRALRDPGLRAGALAGGERVAEQPVEDRPGRALDERQLVGALDLALDLGLADDHRVEARGDAEEMLGRRASRAASRGCPTSSVGWMLGLAREQPEREATRPRPGRPRRGRARSGCRWRSPPPRGSRALERARRRTPTARPSVSAIRSRSSSGAVLWETPSARSSLTPAPLPVSRPSAAGVRQLRELGELAVDARQARGHDRDVDQEQGEEDEVGAGDVLAGLVERQRGHQLGLRRLARDSRRDPGAARSAASSPSSARRSRPSRARDDFAASSKLHQRLPQQRHARRGRRGR